MIINLEKASFLCQTCDHLQPQARQQAEKEGFEVFVAKTSFKANTKALAENEGEGLAKVISIIIYQFKCYVLHNTVDKYCYA